MKNLSKKLLSGVCLGIMGLSLFTSCRSPRNYSHNIEMTDRKATPQDVINFYKDISFYVCDDADIAKELVEIKQQIKMGMQVNKRKLDLLALKIIKCKKKKKAPKRFYSRLKMLYLYGDVPDVSVELDPILLFQKPSKKYQAILDKTIHVKLSKDNFLLIPCGFYNVKISAKLKAHVNASLVALPDDTFILYFATSPSSEQVLAFRGANVITLQHGVGLLCINSQRNNATFKLKAPFKMKPIEENPVDLITQKLIDKYPELEDYYSSPGYILNMNYQMVRDTNSPYKKFISILQTENGNDTITLPTPIFLAVPAGKYTINGKTSIIEAESFQKIWIK
jgi:hypothetical protein